MGMWRMGRIRRCADIGGGGRPWGSGDWDRCDQTRNVHWEAEEFEHADWDQACRPVLYRARTAQHIRVRSLPVAAARWERRRRRASMMRPIIASAGERPPAAVPSPADGVYVPSAVRGDAAEVCIFTQRERWMRNGMC